MNRGGMKEIFIDGFQLKHFFSDSIPPNEALFRHLAGHSDRGR
jgi:hypothetical protein